MKTRTAKLGSWRAILPFITLATLTVCAWPTYAFAVNKKQKEKKEITQYTVTGHDPKAFADAEALLTLPGRSTMDDETFKKVLSVLEMSATQGDPWSPALWFQLDRLRSVIMSPAQIQALQDIAQKMAVIESAPLANRAASADRSFREGNRQYEAGKFDQAVESYRAALRDQPAHWNAWNNLALAEMHSGNDAASLFLLTALVKRNPKYGGGAVNLSVCLERLGQSSSAFDTASAAASKNPQMPMAQYNWAWFENSRGNYEAADAALSRIKATVSDYSVAKWLQALNSMESGHDITADEFQTLPQNDRSLGIPKLVVRPVKIDDADAYSGNAVAAHIPNDSRLLISQEYGDWCAVYWPVNNVKHRLWVNRASLGDGLKPFLGNWTGKWADVTDNMTVKERNGKPVVGEEGMIIWDEKVENGKLSFKARVNYSGWEFVYTLTPTPDGLRMDLLRLKDSTRFTGKLHRK